MIMILRPARPDDAAALALLGRDSFIAAFGHLYAPEDLMAFLDSAHTEEVVGAQIADPGYQCQLAVEDDGTIAGFCKLVSPGTFADYSDAPNPITLSQLYTHPARIGGGVGAQLLEWVIATARADGHGAIHLSVWSENPGAQRCYARYGFVKIADITFQVGDQQDEDLLFELRLLGDDQ